jgi:GTPase SAR1 family protein
VGSDIVLCVAGNKSDLDRKRVVSRQDATAYAESVGAHYAETSAKTGRGIDDMFGAMGRRLLQSRKLSQGAAATTPGRPRVMIADDAEAPRPSGGCC